MQGYIIVSINEENSEHEGYLSGSSIQEELTSATFFQSKEEARAILGRMQAYFSDKELRLIPATFSITLN